jgi:predicted nucleotidyltransferase
MPVRTPPRASRLERLRQELRALLPRLVDADTEKVILFGPSGERGDATTPGDLDLLVVRHDRRPPLARVDDLYRRLQGGLAVDLLVYTPEELAAAAKASSLVRSALSEGEVLYDRSAAPG